MNKYIRCKDMNRHDMTLKHDNRIKDVSSFQQRWSWITLNEVYRIEFFAENSEPKYAMNGTKL